MQMRVLGWMKCDALRMERWRQNWEKFIHEKRSLHCHLVVAEAGCKFSTVAPFSNGPLERLLTQIMTVGSTSTVPITLIKEHPSTKTNFYEHPFTKTNFYWHWWEGRGHYWGELLNFLLLSQVNSVVTIILGCVLVSYRLHTSTIVVCGQSASHSAQTHLYGKIYGISAVNLSSALNGSKRVLFYMYCCSVYWGTGTCPSYCNKIMSTF